LAPMLWHSCGTIAALLQVEMVSPLEFGCKLHSYKLFL
jgi:hypothetical protein